MRSSYTKRAIVPACPRAIETAPLKLVALPISIPRNGEILVRVETRGVCRTDLHLVEGKLPRRQKTDIPGHGIVGRVERAGPRVRQWKVGDRVGVACKYTEAL